MTAEDWEALWMPFMAVCIVVTTVALACLR